MLGDDDSSASAAEADDINPGAAELDAGLFDSPENPFDSTTPAPPRSSDGWHDIDDFLERAPPLRLAEQGASTPDSLPHLHPSRLSSEPSHDSIRTDSTATTPSSSPPPPHCRASPETQLSQEGHPHTGREVADEHEPVDHTLDTLLTDEGAKKQQEGEQGKDESNSEDADEGLQQELNILAPVLAAESAGGSTRLADRRQSLLNLDISPEPSYHEAGSNSDNDVELNSTDSTGDDEKEPRPAKRKQLSASYGGLARKKRRRPLRESSSCQRRPLSKPYR